MEKRDIVGALNDYLNRGKIAAFVIVHVSRDIKACKKMCMEKERSTDKKKQLCTYIVVNKNSFAINSYVYTYSIRGLILIRLK